ncbi:MAG TPA: hypothetical protein PK712_10050 [Rectinema sp.]|nr:hypothetical protein [Rectinema sp.]
MWTYQYVDRKDILHYGVPGMKRGVRRGIAASARTGARYGQMADADKLSDKRARRASMGKSTSRIDKKIKSARNNEKMFRYVAKQSVKGLSKADVAKGKKQVNSIMEGFVGGLGAAGDISRSNRRLKKAGLYPKN